ncbi:FAD-dependent oxidoreductase [Halopolyspora algeriensis]|nr:FAD-dependent oxidoreductase [Halopolyspora algeriensis]
MDVERPSFSPSENGRSFDVAVLGGGITGLTTALLLKRQGARVAVLEADRVASGTTGSNTAKVTALQSTLYSTVRSHRGSRAAATYASASAAAVDKVAELCEEESISCDLRRRTAYTYAVDDAELRSIEREAAVTHEAGLPTVLDDDTDLPFPVTGALRLDDQIEFHPVRYALGLARAVHGDGSQVCEHTRALNVLEGSPCRVRTSSGTVTADQVVVATHYPILDRGLYFARLEPDRSYCLAARVRGSPPRGLSINAGSPKRSLRSYGDLLVLAGESHPTGARGVGAQQYGRLEEFAHRHWDVEEITHRWSAQDPTAYDHFPMVGPHTPESSRLFVATGFMKWGLTGGTFSGMVLADLIGRRPNPWAETLSPTRFSPHSSPTLVRINAGVGADFVGDRFAPGQAGSAEDIPRGEAGVVRQGSERTGVYRDEDGMLHAVSLRCTHLGCLLRFNGADRSWDCPCHGSRFDIDGSVLEGPAVRPLECKPPPTRRDR